MNRRDAIKRLAFLTGSALSMSTVAGILGGCTSNSGSGSFTPETLSSDQNKMVTVISELIIPETDTPGAKGAKVNEFIDKMLTDWNTEKERKHFLAGLDHVNEVSDSSYQKAFMDLSESEQTEILKKLEKEAMENPQPVTDTEIKPFFAMVKELTITGYYTSEIGASQELKANIIPGYYEACMPYSEVGTAWS